MKKNVLLLSVSAIILVAFSYGLFSAINAKHLAELKNGKDIVAKIDGLTITADDLYNKLKATAGTSITIKMIDDYIANKEFPVTAAITTTAQEQLDTYKLQYQQQGQDFAAEIARYGYANEAAFKEYLIFTIQQNNIVEKYLTDHLTTADIEKYYKDEIFGAITARHILITPKTTSTMTAIEITAAEATALATAKEVIAKLKAGEKFTDLVKEYSADTASVADGGKLTFKKAEVDPGFWAGAYPLKDNAYTQTPVKSAYGYHIILKLSQTAKPTLKEAKADIVKEMIDTKLRTDTALFSKTLDNVRKSYKMNIMDSYIKDIYDINLTK